MGQRELTSKEKRIQRKNNINKKMKQVQKVKRNDSL